MTQVTCKHSGIKFEAASKRTTQHPQVAALKNAAHAAGNYGEVMTALEVAQKRGGYETIEQYVAIVNEIAGGKVNAKRDAARQEREAERQREEERQQRKRERQVRNAHLRQYGYYWHREEDDDERQIHFEEPGWYLLAPDGRVVSVQQALSEIEEMQRMTEEDAQRHGAQPVSFTEIHQAAKAAGAHLTRNRHGHLRYNIQALHEDHSVSDAAFGAAVDWNDWLDVLAERMAAQKTEAAAPAAAPDGIDNWPEEDLAARLDL